MSSQWIMMQNLERNCLVSSKFHMKNLTIFTQAAKNLKNIHFNGLLLTCNVAEFVMFYIKKCTGDIFDGTEDWCKMWRKTDLFFQWWIWQVTWWQWQIFVHRLKNSDFMWEREMVELNQNKNSRQPDRTDAVWKLCLTFEMNE